MCCDLEQRPTLFSVSVFPCVIPGAFTKVNANLLNKEILDYRGLNGICFPFT